MSSKIIAQKELMKRALRYLEVIETCDAHIITGNQAIYFRHVRQNAVNEYVHTVSNLLLNTTKTDLINEL